jgi:hypothetical protein
MTNKEFVVEKQRELLRLMMYMEKVACEPVSGDVFANINRVARIYAIAQQISVVSNSTIESMPDAN